MMDTRKVGPSTGKMDSVRCGGDSDDRPLLPQPCCEIDDVLLSSSGTLGRPDHAHAVAGMDSTMQVLSKILYNL